NRALIIRPMDGSVLPPPPRRPDEPGGVPTAGSSAEPPGGTGGRQRSSRRRLGAFVAASLATVMGGTVLGIVLAHSHPATDQKTQLKAPSNLKASLDGITVHLSWSPSAGLGSRGYYDVYRDDTWIGPVTSNSFEDTSVPLGVSQTYYVKASVGNSFSPPSNRVSVLVARPSLAEARLTGSYEFRWKVVSQVGHWHRFSVGDSGSHWTWRFKPKCSDGACQVQVSLTEHGPDPHGPLKSMGG